MNSLPSVVITIIKVFSNLISKSEQRYLNVERRLKRHFPALARQLIDGYSLRKREGRPASFQAKNYVVPDDVRLGSVGNHMPKMVSNYRRRRNVAERDKSDLLHVCRM
ncbi:piggyBac transposable element-derived protein 4 [Trichonephila clavipes]|nr:piggyBac transposable element-derived protein 4 [Trichonephila clavipes]